MKVVQHRISDAELDGIKALLAEATTGADGVMPVVRDNSWGFWIGRAKAHLQVLIESAERAQ